MTKAANGAGKDIIYIDVDDEITAIIDKVRDSEQRIVALVLPKRAAAFQSVVNMKLLKRSAEQAKKHVVLITSDASLLPLAGGVGLHVAKSLQSKPEIPTAPEPAGDSADDVEEAEIGEDPVPSKAVAAPSKKDDAEETIELDNTEDEPQHGAGAATGKKAAKDGKKRFKIPNFNRFRLWLLLGAAGLVLLIVLGILAFVVLPKAKIVVSTDSSAIEVSQDINLKTGENATLDVAQSILPATKEEVKKTLTEEVPATGQQNRGEKATGSVTLSLKNCSDDEVTVPAGTGLSANGKTFITKTSATMESVEVGNQCKNSQFPQFSTKTVPVEAQTGGADFNLGPSAFTVAGFSNVAGQSSAAMSGGTDNIIKIVTQADIDSAKQKIVGQDSQAAKEELKQALASKDLFVIESTFATAAPTTQQSVNVGDEAASVKVTQEVVYSMLGVKRDDLEKIVAEQVNKEIDPAKQSILDYGFDEAAFALLTAQPDGAVMGFQTTAVAGSSLDAEEIKKQIAGKKASEAEELIKENPGVTEVQVSYSPFWVSSIPKKTGKITVVIEELQIKENDAQQTESSQ